ncbi:hypothetical protein GCM10010293_61500 [Streptomyces griseoflavus]|uniref:ATP-dependent DNA ligase n=1 Tax=Streptomyces griseoflavus TaxID=35619 RepID=UPI0019B14999|nr:hypothetical protein [Streptomyces griseoflavus]GGV50465.1 hypothetical protein GCM10010293_61500 [Streptomyces griseoflavus]
MTWSLPQPMLTVPVDSPALPAGYVAEPKWDGFRVQLAVHSGGRVLLRSRQGTDMTGFLSELCSVAASVTSCEEEQVSREVEVVELATGQRGGLRC